MSCQSRPGRIPGRIASLLYSLLWTLAGPLTFASPRMRQGWKERLGMGLPQCDIWIQGASAGECALVQPLLDHLPHHLPGLSILTTTCTWQGRETLERITQAQVHPRMLPLDHPALMRRALRTVRPRVVVLLETEIWPGLLQACADQCVPVVVVNARMNPKSLAGYLWLRPFLRPPVAVGAIAQTDARRFELVFGPCAQVTGNIKFDRALDAPLLERPDNPLAWLVPATTPFLVFGSVREEEEPEVLNLLLAVRALHPECVIGLFPRHLHRIPDWQARLTQARLNWTLRSSLKSAAPAGSIILWDQFGELGQAYALAHRAFVGGSLARLGGQNFLEPLAQGVLPAVGPHTRNFSWIGPDIFELVFQSADIQALARNLTSPAPDRHKVRAKAEAYIRNRQGAAAASAALIARCLEK